MPFCWMDEESGSVVETTTKAETAINEIRERASLLRRLGYAKADAVHRCLGNVAWAHSVSGTPAVSPSQIRKTVGEVYAGA